MRAANITLPSRARARPRARGRKEEAVIVYHRTRDRMPTHDLMMKWLSTVKNVVVFLLLTACIVRRLRSADVAQQPRLR